MLHVYVGLKSRYILQGVSKKEIFKMYQDNTKSIHTFLSRAFFEFCNDMHCFNIAINGAFVVPVIFSTDYISPMSNIYETYTMVIAVNQIFILWLMDRAILKTLENRLKEKVGQTVQSLDIISQEFILVLVTCSTTLTNFDVVKWLQVYDSSYMKS